MQQASRFLSWLRKAAPYLLIIAFGFIVLFGQRGVNAVANKINGVDEPETYAKNSPMRVLAKLGDPRAQADVYKADSTALTEMSSAEVAATQQAAGWPPTGTVVGKLITAAWFFLFFVMLRWLTQQLTHPAPTLWAKKEYAADFESLPTQEKFVVYRGIRMDSAIMAAASLLAASLVQ